MQTTAASDIPQRHNPTENDTVVEIGLTAHLNYWQNTPSIQGLPHAMVGTITYEGVQKSDIFMTMLVPRGTGVSQLGIICTLESAEHFANDILKNVNDIRNGGLY